MSERSKEIYEKYKDMLRKYEGVAGTSYNGSIIVYVKEDTVKARSFIPRTLEGVPVKVVRSGQPTVLSVPVVRAIYNNRVKRIRPLVGGISVGHPEVTAGTLTGFLERDGEIIGHANSHVGCPQWGDTQLGDVGDPVYQPGVYDGGSEEDEIGEVIGVESIETYKSNRLDSMIFSIKEEIQKMIMEVGRYFHTVEPYRGMAVKKSGARSGVNYSKVIDVNATFEVSAWEDVTFENVVVLSPACAIPGDSGAWVGDDNDRTSLVIFAGSPYVTLAMRASDIERRWNAKFAMPTEYVSLSKVATPIAIGGVVGVGIMGGIKK